jgi:hypothetical protein
MLLGRTTMGRPSSLREIANLFPQPWRENHFGANSPVLIAGGAAVDLATASDIDIFFYGNLAKTAFLAWKNHLEVIDDTIVVSKQKTERKSQYTYFANLIAERWQIGHPDLDLYIDVIVMEPSMCRTPEKILETFDLRNIQIGYKLDGTLVTTDEYIPDGDIQFSRSGLDRLHFYARDPKKVQDRLRKYQRKLNRWVRYDQGAATIIPGIFNEVSINYQPLDAGPLNPLLERT